MGSRAHTEFSFSDPSFWSVELEITLRCNDRCWSCNRLVGIVPEPTDSDMSMDQIDRKY